MDISAILSAVTGHPFTPDDVRAAACTCWSLAPLLPAIVLTVVAVAPSRRRSAASASRQRVLSPRAMI